MNGDREFVRALSDYLALHTEQSSSYLAFLIASFLRGSQEKPKFEQKAKGELAGRLKADLATHNNVPSFLQNYLHTHLAQANGRRRRLFLPRAICSAVPVKDLSTGNGDSNVLPNSKASRSAARSSAIARCCTAKALKPCSAGAACRASRPITISPSTPC